MTVLAALVAATLQSPVEIPFRIAENAIIVDALVNQRRLSFMFDTGFSGHLVVDTSVNLGKATGSLLLRDFVGQFQAQTVRVKSLKLGSLEVAGDDLEAVQLPTGRSSFAYNAHVDGIMGLDVLRDRVVEINFERSRFIVHPSSTDISKRTPDGKKTFLLKMLPKGKGSVELEVAAPGGKKMVLGLDTGNAFFATSHRDVLERCGLWPVGKQPKFVRSSFVASGEVPSWAVKLKDLTIFGVPVAESYWDIIDLPSSSADHDGTVGFGFLRNFNVTLDYERRRVWLDNFTGKVANSPVGDVGITAAFDGRTRRVRVYRVAPGGPAERAGVQVGDDLLSIDDVEMSEHMGIRQIDLMLEGEKGTSVRLAASRRGNLMRFTLVREYLYNE